MDAIYSRITARGLGQPCHFTEDALPLASLVTPLALAQVLSTATSMAPASIMAAFLARTIIGAQEEEVEKL